MNLGGRADGLQALADAVGELAEQAPELRLSALLARLRSPIRTAVLGRSGVGRRTVSAALGRNGVAIAPDEARADVRVLVIAEVLKPEDEAVLATGPPTLIVLNKADLTGSAGGGPMANARRRATEIGRLTGVPTVAMVGLLAASEAVIDDELVAALRAMVTDPADLTSVDAFSAADHSVGRAVRERLLAGLDRFGIALAVVALARGGAPENLPTLLHDASNVDDVLTQMRHVAASARYGRVRRALGELLTVATQSGDQRLAALLASDAAVLSAMAVAADVVEAEGMTVDARDDAVAHRRRAVSWRRYGSGPVNALHRQCSADIVRGSLRLLDGVSR